MFKHNQYTLSQVIEYVVNSQYEDDDFCIYGDDSIPLNLRNSYLVSDYPEVINDRDDYPSDVKEKNLSLVYYGEQFIDVICSALEQKPSASEQELVEALIFYYQNDNFMTLKP